jgi:hypothetical protein
VRLNTTESKYLTSTDEYHHNKIFKNTNDTLEFMLTQKEPQIHRGTIPMSPIELSRREYFSPIHSPRPGTKNTVNTCRNLKRD